jgi:uroporphyrin-III C-methyltransferase
MHCLLSPIDPYVFGRGGEEYLFFQQLGYTPEVIPGISSAMAAPLFADIPVTHRGVASQLLICTGTGKKNTKPDIPPYHPTRTTVILMGIHRIRQLANELMEIGGYPEDCPCAVVERASCPDQRVVHGTVGTIASIMERVGSMPPGTLIIGRTCEVLRGSQANDISLGRLFAEQDIEVMER